MINMIQKTLFTLTFLLMVTHAQAQNFNAAYRVNSEVITYYEIDQMEKMMTLTGTPPAKARDAAIDFLINARLLKAEVQRLGMKLDDNMINNALSSMAVEGGPDELRAQFRKEGVSNETIDAYIGAQISRRSYAQLRGIDTSENYEREAEIITAIPDQVTKTISISEIVLPYAEYGGRIPTRFEYKVITRKLRSGTPFSKIARQTSRSSTASEGGAYPDIPVEGLTPELETMLKGLSPGQISGPIEVDGAIIILRLNGYKEVRNSLPRDPKVTYIDLFTSASKGLGTSKQKALSIQSRVQTCAHAEALIPEMPGSEKNEKVSLSKLPSGISLALSRMESGTHQVYERENGTSVLYLCSREVEVPEEYKQVIKSRASSKVYDSRLNGLLRDLRASASIVDLTK